MAPSTSEPRIGLFASFVKLLLIAALCVCAALSLGGCRYTDVLTEHIEDEELGELDPDQDPIYIEDPDAEQDDRQSSTEVKDTDRVDQQEESVPTYDPDAEEDGVAVNRVYDEKSAKDEAAAEGDEPSDEENEQSSETTDEETPEKESSSDSDSDESDDDGSPDSTSGGDDSDDDGSGSDPSGEGPGGNGKSYDPSGENQELPEDTGTVAAAGTYATIVQMLAGKGGLVATDSAWKKEVSNRGLFSGEGTQSLATVWSGSAEKGYKLNIKALIKAAPDALIIDGTTTTLTDKQQKKIQDAGINIITLPALGLAGTPDEYIMTAVGTVGELLKNSSETEYNTQSAAELYESMHDECIAAVQEANGGYTTKSINGSSYNYIYQDSSGKGVGTETTSFSSNRISTAYIAGWASSKSSSVTAIREYLNVELALNGTNLDASDGYGLSDTVTGKQFALLDYYLQVAGVVNNAYDTKRPTSTTSGGDTAPYAVIAGSPTNIGLIKSSDSISTRTTLSSALWYSPTSSTDTSSWVTVGDETFPGVLVKTTDIAESLTASAAKSNGLYNVGQAYSVYVAPSGIDGSWSTATPESFLMSVWALKTYWDDASAEEAAASWVNQYYETFYRCSSSEGTSKVTNYDTTYTAGS